MALTEAQTFCTPYASATLNCGHDAPHTQYRLRRNHRNLLERKVGHILQASIRVSNWLHSAAVLFCAFFILECVTRKACRVMTFIFLLECRVSVVIILLQWCDIFISEHHYIGHYSLKYLKGQKSWGANKPWPLTKGFPPLPTHSACQNEDV